MEGGQATVLPQRTRGGQGWTAGSVFAPIPSHPSCSPQTRGCPRAPAPTAPAGRQGWGPRGKGTTKAGFRFHKGTGHGAHRPLGHAGLGQRSRAPKTMREGVQRGSSPRSRVPCCPTNQQGLCGSEQPPCFSRFWVHMWAGSFRRLWGESTPPTPVWFLASALILGSAPPPQLLRPPPLPGLTLHTSL